MKRLDVTGLAPVVVTLNSASREQVMDEHPLTYLISSRELEREGKLRKFGAFEGTNISNPENYLFVESRVVNKGARLAVLVRLEGDNFFRSSHLGVYDMAIERSGWVRTAIELPPATQPKCVPVSPRLPWGVILTTPCAHATF